MSKAELDRLGAEAERNARVAMSRSSRLPPRRSAPPWWPKDRGKSSPPRRACPATADHDDHRCARRTSHTSNPRRCRRALVRPGGTKFCESAAVATMTHIMVLRKAGNRPVMALLLVRASLLSIGVVVAVAGCDKKNAAVSTQGNGAGASSNPTPVNYQQNRSSIVY